MNFKESSAFLWIFLVTTLFYFPVITAPADPSFNCLNQSGPLEVVNGHYDTDRFEPDTAPYKKFDARSATFELPDTHNHQMISLRDPNGDNHNVCWAGGYVTSSLDWHGLDISWYQSKHGYDNTENDRGNMENTTAASAYGDKITWTGLYVYNVHDGIRTNNSEDNWTVQHSWFEYIRDDCIENDHIYSGRVFDVLFDGCYTGFSVRPSSSGTGQGTTITFEKVLMRMEPMPYPYKWDEKSDPKLYPTGYGDIPFGYNNTFKLDKGNEPTFEITNSVFLYEYNAGKRIFPPKEFVSDCRNNTIIWLAGPQSAPGYLHSEFPGCFRIITDAAQGRQIWQDYVSDWHHRHPGVGADRKPSNPGVYTWPRFPADAAQERIDQEGFNIIDYIFSYIGSAPPVR